MQKTKYSYLPVAHRSDKCSGEKRKNFYYYRSVNFYLESKMEIPESLYKDNF